MVTWNTSDDVECKSLLELWEALQAAKADSHVKRTESVDDPHGRRIGFSTRDFDGLLMKTYMVHLSVSLREQPNWNNALRTAQGRSELFFHEKPLPE